MLLYGVIFNAYSEFDYSMFRKAIYDLGDYNIGDLPKLIDTIDQILKTNLSNLDEFIKS